MNTLSRRAVLAGGALLVSGSVVSCTAGAPEPQTPQAPDPEDVLLGQLIADKERTIALYTALMGGGSEVLRPFVERHRTHLAELRRRSPLALATEAPTATPSASPSASPTPSMEAKVTLTRLRDVERKAAAMRLRQLADASPSLAQLIASIGACEAAHAVALPRAL